MTAVRVYIATTEGPAEVQRITEEEPNVGSVICLDGKALALPISPDYEAFVRMPTGILEKAYGHPAYRMDVSATISEGMSWQLGALVAHALLAAGRLATKGQAASQAVWLSGEVDRDLQVLPVQYVREKLRRSQRLFDDLRAAEIPLVLGIPKPNHDELDAGWLKELGLAPDQCRVIPMSSADQILDVLGLPGPFARGPQAASARAAAPGGDARHVMGALFALLLLGGLAGSFGWWRYHIDPPARDPPAPSPGGQPAPSEAPGRIGITALEARAPDEGSCAAVNFGTAEAATTEVALSDAMAVATAASAELCSLRYRVKNRGDRAEVWIVGARAAKDAPSLKPKVFAQGRILNPDESVLLEIRVPRSLQESLLHRLAVIVVPDGDGTRRRRLKDFIAALDRPVDEATWDRGLSGLQTAGLPVTRMTHELQP